METKLSINNPFGYSRYGFAFEYIKNNTKCLDFGCFDGKFIYKSLKYKNIEFIGVDRNVEIIKKNPYKLKLININSNNNLPFKNETFNYISILDVIEHIYDQKKILIELNRILKKGGIIIITVPRKHIFSFLDTGNYKFIFTKLHKIYYILKNSKSEYKERYLENPNGLIGDVEIEKSWHQHFNEKELADLINGCGFSVVYFDGTGLFARVFSVLKLFGFKLLISNKMIKNDYKNFKKANLFCVAKKE